MDTKAAGSARSHRSWDVRATFWHREGDLLWEQLQPSVKPWGWSSAMRFYFHNQTLADGWPGDAHCRLVVGMEGLVLPLFRIRLPFRLLTVHRNNPSAPVTSRSALRPNVAPG